MAGTSKKPIKVRILSKDGKSTKTTAYKTRDGADAAAREHRNKGHYVTIEDTRRKKKS